MFISVAFKTGADLRKCRVLLYVGHPSVDILCERIVYVISPDCSTYLRTTCNTQIILIMFALCVCILLY